MNEEYTVALEELGEIKTVKVYNQAYVEELEEDLRNKKLAIQNRNGRIKELEEKISILLSCKNCTENKGGYICEKEYEDKCLTQKIQYIKELQEEIAELKAHNKSVCESLTNTHRHMREQLDEAKDVIVALLNTFPYDMADEDLDVGQIDVMLKAEQFLKEV